MEKTGTVARLPFRGSCSQTYFKGLSLVLNRAGDNPSQLLGSYCLIGVRCCFSTSHLVAKLLIPGLRFRLCPSITFVIPEPHPTVYRTTALSTRNTREIYENVCVPHENVVRDHGHEVHELHPVERAGSLVSGRQRPDLGLQQPLVRR